MKTLSEIFNNRPVQWGLRGDPFLWDEMKDYFSGTELPYSKELFADEFHHQFELLTGARLGSESSTYVRRYAVSGMSKGLVSHKFWSEKGLPLLISGLENLNEET